MNWFYNHLISCVRLAENLDTKSRIYILTSSAWNIMVSGDLPVNNQGVIFIICHYV